MKNIVRIAVFLLILLMIVPCLAACNKTDKGTTTKPDGPVTPDEDPYLEQVGDLERYNYKAFVRGNMSGNTSYACEDFWVDPATGGGDALSYAVIERNSEIESTYINLDHEAFDQNSIAELTLGDSLYYLSGDMNISTLDNTIATVFNTKEYAAMADSLIDKFEDSDFDSPYTLVEEGKWTVENMLKIAKEFTLDANTNDGPLSYDKGDKMGYFEYAASPLYYYYGAGMRVTENVGGFPEFVIDSDEAQEVYNYLYSALNTNLNNHPNGLSGDRAKNFLSGDVLFADFLLWDTRKHLYPAKIDWAYGILPIPTYEENEDYHCVVYFQTCAHLWALPYKRADNVKAAKLFYVMTVYSGEEDSTLDAYYVRTMYMEVAKDDGSRASLEIIRNSLVYDIALLYCPQNLWGKFDDLLVNMDTATQPEYSTYTTASRMDDAQADMEETIDAFIKYGAD